MDVIIDKGCGLDVHKQTVVACVRGSGIKKEIGVFLFHNVLTHYFFTPYVNLLIKKIDFSGTTLWSWLPAVLCKCPTHRPYVRQGSQPRGCPSSDKHLPCYCKH